MEIHQSRSLAGLSVADQKILCAIAYLGRNHPLMLPDEKMLSWMGCDKHSYKDQVKNLSSIGWLVEGAQHHESCHLLLINPKKLSEVLDFLLTAGREWIREIETLVPDFSSFKNFESLVVAFFDADIIDSCSVLSRFCETLTEKQNIAREMLSLFRYYSHGEFCPVERGTTAYTFILYGLRYLHNGKYEKAASMWSQALALNGNRLFRNPLTMYFLIASYARRGEKGVKSLQSFLHDKPLHPLEAVPAIIVAEYYASKSKHPSSWRLAEYLRHCNHPYHRLELTMGVLLTKMFDLDIPLDIDTEQLPDHRILRHEFQCLLYLDAAEVATLTKAFGKVTAFDSVPAASWQQCLDELIDVCKVVTRQSYVSKSRMTRIIYLINGSSVSLRRQYCNTEGEWDVCKRIQLCEYTASMPEMNEMDVAIYNNCRGNMLHLGLENTLPFLIGSDRVFTGMLPPYKPISIRNVIPALIIEKAEDGLLLTSNFSPVELSKCGKTDFIIKQDERNYDVIHIQHAQELYFRKLLSHPKLPIEAKAKLKILASQPNLPICILSSDLPGMNTYSFINGCNNITIRITPRRNNNFDISFVCYPLTGGRIAFTPGTGNTLYSDTDDKKYYCIHRNLDKELRALENVKTKLSAILKRTVRLSEDTISRLQLLNLLRSWHDEGENDFAVEWPSGGCITIHDNGCSSNKLYLSQVSTSWFQLRGKVYIDEDYFLDICELLAVLERKPIGGLYYPVDEKTFIRLSRVLQKQIETIGNLATRNENTVLIPSARTSELANLANNSLGIECDEQFNKLQQQIKEAYTTKFYVPSELNATLRSYQKEGFEWMARLDYWGAGACLADDMGLGKTIQTITMLLHKASGGVSIVVSPAAVLYNWADEITRFAPSLIPIVLRDQPDRKATLSALKPHDVVLVSYSMLVNMREDLLSIEWNMVCLDEAHVIKSANTEIAKAVLRLKARTRLALSGTPLQNKAIDIWSIFQFLNPGLLGEHSTFYAHYASNPLQQERLRKVLSPFILRRTKKEVLLELPSKTDIFVRIEMNPQETAVYEAVRQKAEHAIRISDGNIKSVFSHITRARMAACSASILHPDIQVPSSKLERLMLLVSDLIAENKKVLVFSQFIPFLKMASERLSTNGYSCLLYTGMQDSKKRQEIIQSFKSDNVQVLLISLHAGGVGLNLTEACTVVHLDVWWNPAIELQATDRAYRIGQKENVTVYHLVARNTIEENIIRLHHRKLSLASSILDGTDACLGMSADDVLKIFQST